MRWPLKAAALVSMVFIASALPRATIMPDPCVRCVTVIHWKPHVEEVASQVVTKKHDRGRRIAATGLTIPTPKPLALTKPAAVKKKVVKKRSTLCGSKTPVWRTLANGHRKYRCK